MKEKTIVLYIPESAEDCDCLSCKDCYIFREKPENEPCKLWEKLHGDTIKNKPISNFDKEKC